MKLFTPQLIVHGRSQQDQICAYAHYDSFSRLASGGVGSHKPWLSDRRTFVGCHRHHTRTRIPPTWTAPWSAGTVAKGGNDF